MQQVGKDLYQTRLAGSPQRIARQEPVVHNADWSEAPLSRDALAAFERDGFLVLENVFSPREVEQMRSTAEAMRAHPASLARETVISEPDAGAVRSVFAPHRQSDEFDLISRDPRLAGLARFILDDEVYIHQSRLNYKPAFTGKEFYWHSDFETWHAEDGMPRMRALSMSVMLTDNHPQAGPVMFVPGSQKQFIACVGETPDENYKSSLKRQRTGIPDRASISAMVEAGGIEAPAPKAGSVVIFDCNTLHASSGNITPFERMNAFFVFNAWSNRLEQPFAASSPRPEHIAHRRVDGPLRPIARGQWDIS